MLCVIPYEKEKPEGSLHMDFSSLYLSLFSLDDSVACVLAAGMVELPALS